MRSYTGLGVLGLSLIAFVSGCGTDEPVAEKAAPVNTQQPTAGLELPLIDRKPRVETPSDFADAKATVEGFLKAMCGRNETQVAHLLSTKAREEAARHNHRISALGSESSRCEVGEPRACKLADGSEGQEVDFTFQDHDEQGAPFSFSASYLLRREEGQWRISGMKAPLPGSSTSVVFNYEDFASMEANQRLAEAQIKGQPAESTAAIPNPAERQR